ncbi:MAG: hypothetical protein E4H40_01035 [Candidatus Brocadiia bacterium]|nr:MAG: hypothetical protein E4H40_01035 [Candidatus Brocadiia bacterium]
MNRSATLKPVGFTFSFFIISAVSLFSAEKPSYYVIKDSWQETMYASRQALIDFEARQTIQNTAKIRELGIETGPWYLVGPFDGVKQDPYETQFGPELDTDLNKTYGQLKWTPKPDWKDGDIHILPGQGRAVANYVYRTISANKDAKLPIYLGSSDGIQVWFNGQKVLANKIDRKAEADQDIIELDFKQGENELLLKINNQASRHDFYFAILPGRGKKAELRKQLWDVIELDFAGDTERQQMRWEREDRIWEEDPNSGYISKLAQRYAHAAANFEPFSGKAKLFSGKVENFDQLKDVRKIYYVSKRFEYNLRSVNQKRKLMKNEADYFSQMYKADHTQWEKYKAELAIIEAKNNKISAKVRAGDFSALESLPEIETELEKIYSRQSAIPGGAKALQCHPFELKDVRLLDGPFRTAMELDRKYLYDLDSDRLLHMFRVTAELPSTAQPLGGWEARGLRGHTIGHYLTACALMYASTADENLKVKADYIVAELAKCQTASGNGYLSAFPEKCVKDVIYGTGGWWAPWYTLHKIFAGLIDMYNYCGNQQAIDIALKMASWAKGHLDNLNEEQMQRMLETEYGGMNETLCDLYMITKNPDHLALAKKFDHKKIFEPLTKFEDRLKGLHVNTQIPKIIGTAREFELTGEKYYYNISAYFWTEVVDARTYCTGGTSNHEHWRTEPYKLAAELSPATQETCCTYNMLKLTRHLFTWQPNAEYADYYETALYNSILSTQDPKTGMMMYHVPLNSGHWKSFNTPYDSFWCCTGTGLENHAKYGDSIYFHDDKGLYVNLFIASELNWTDKGVQILQQTNFPEEQQTTLMIKTKKPAEFDLRIRVPSWLIGPMTVKINGSKQKAKTQPGSYLTLKQTWKNGDRITIDLPMGLHLHRMPDDAGLAAIMYGPLVMAGELGTEGLPDNVFLKKQLEQNITPAYPPVPEFFADSDRIEKWIKPVEGQPLTFKTVNAGKPRDVKLVPYYRLFDQRYSIYWRLNPADQ